MKKSITKEQVIETTLALLKDKREIQSLNLREISRSVGCAHTNLYHYFSSFHDLLWEVHMAVQNKFVAALSMALSEENEPEKEIYCFFLTLSGLYLDHKGWFRLAWLEYIEEEPPEKDRLVTEQAVAAMVEMLEEVWVKKNVPSPGKERIHQVLHDVHCYMVGEVSNYIHGRGVIQDENLLRLHIAETAVTFFQLCFQEG